MTVVELPDWAVPNGAEPFAIPFGYWLTPSTGAEEQFAERMGGRFGATISFPPLPADMARILISRLTEAWFSGATIKIDWPLVDLSQGAPGEPVVDGSGQSGKVINIAGLTPGYAFKEGYWLTFVDENGRGYLHNNRIPGRAAADGTASITISPITRWPFLNGAEIRIGKPTIEGKVTAAPWQVPVDRLIRVGFEIREIA